MIREPYEADMDSSLDQIIERLRSPGSSVRVHACRALAESGDPRAIDPLIGRLGDEEAVRRAACESLGRIGDARAVGPLIARLFGDRMARVRQAACESLGKIGDARAVGPLIARLGDEDRDVRRAACKALGSVADALAVDPLLERLADQDSVTRGAACDALGKIGDRRVAGRLLLRLADPDSGVCLAAHQALERLGEGRIARAMAGLLKGDPESHEELRRLLEEGDFRAQDAIILSEARFFATAQAIQAIQLVLTKPLKPQWKSLLCSVCLARVELKQGRLGACYACRVCGKLGHALTGIENVVSVLDEGWPEEQRREGGVLRVNWLRRKALFDFDSVEIVRASDIEAERFCIAVGNDMDEHRRARYRKMSCAIRDGGASESAVRNLRSLFGRVSETA